jgi:hypothetical protein
MRLTMKHWIIAGVAVIVAALLLFLFLPHKPAAAAGENGVFANDCCGTMQLTDGKMLLNDQQVVRYTIGRDAQGPYLLPKAYVGARSDEGFEVDGTRPVIKLRLDRLPGTTKIQLYEGQVGYVFRLQPPRPRAKR